MARKLARVVRVDSITPIKKADRIECAHIGGWPCVVRTGEFIAGALGVYFEIDSFLAAGNPYWQHLVDQVSTEYNGQVGHVLRSVVMRGQVSQGLLLPLAVLGPDPQVAAGDDVTERLGVIKFDKPLPKDLAELAIGYRSGLVPSTDQERIQNMADALPGLVASGRRWEVSEKLEGQTCNWALLHDQFHVCSSEVDFRESDIVPHWVVARRLEVEAKLRQHYAGRNIVLQGELVGPGIEGNIYNLKEHDFYLFGMYDADTGYRFLPHERRAMADLLGISCVPLVEEAFVLPLDASTDSLLAMADGASALRPERRREGLVYSAVDAPESFKVVSTLYLVNAKL